MKSGESTSKGMSACEDALQRLLDRKPNVPEHVGLEFSKLTASIVSFEAGFDRGYLKKSRPAHQEIIARIVSIKTKAPIESVKARELQTVAEKLSTTKNNLEEAREQRDNMLTRNLQLMLRVKELEKEVAELRRSQGKKDNVTLFPRRS
tara:strand:+ start:203 stop:649 length:447 start_codon:yes stop_codon:yes gene_type:complete